MLKVHVPVGWVYSTGKVYKVCVGSITGSTLVVDVTLCTQFENKASRIGQAISNVTMVQRS